MPPESRKWLTDMLEAANSITEFVDGKTFPDFANNKMLRGAVYFQYVIIGEALHQLRNFDPRTAGRISESARIIAFRNQVIHGYGKIDDEITWRIIIVKLPLLKRELEQVLKE
jgi:uncharacterized protein with HEPN domain